MIKNIIVLIGSNIRRIFSKKKEFDIMTVPNIPQINKGYTVIEYEKTRVEVALELSCFYFSNKTKYRHNKEYENSFYWLKLANDYLMTNDIHIESLSVPPETVEDVISRAYVIGIHNALDNAGDELTEEVMKRFASSISNFIIMDEYDEDDIKWERSIRRYHEMKRLKKM